MTKEVKAKDTKVFIKSKKCSNHNLSVIEQPSLPMTIHEPETQKTVKSETESYEEDSPLTGGGQEDSCSEVNLGSSADSSWFLSGSKSSGGRKHYPNFDRYFTNKKQKYSSASSASGRGY